VRPAEPFALYVHVPYCRHVCPYCDFNVQAAATPPERGYVEALAAELAAYGGDAHWADRPLGSVYFGGGTPSLFTPGAIADVLAAAGAHFELGADAELTLEANPDTIVPERVAGYRAAGINRLSLGAQSFDDRHLRTLGRDHAAAATPAAVGAARAAGIDNVSLDLIFGVPGETLADWERDLRAAVGLGPPHVSAYALTYEEGTPFHRWRAGGRLRPVEEDLEAAMGEAAEAILEAAGLARYEISSFARPGRESRHNLAYWEGVEYLGVGAGAHSFRRDPVPGRRWVNERVPQRYMAAARASGRAVDSEELLSEAQARGEFCVCGLRTLAGIDVTTFAARFGVTLAEAFPHVDRLVADGLAEHVAGRLRLTARGLRFADTVSTTFL